MQQDERDGLQISRQFYMVPFSSPEAVQLLVSTRNRDLSPRPTPKIRESRTSPHSAHAQSHGKSFYFKGKVFISY